MVLVMTNAVPAHLAPLNDQAEADQISAACDALANSGEWLATGRPMPLLPTTPAGEFEHLDRLMAVHLPTVLAEGPIDLKDPAALDRAFRRMVELDNAALERLARGSSDAERGFQTQDARRFRAAVKVVAAGVHAACAR